MKRKIITIDPNLCTGCGLCASACHEGALKLVNGKAQLVSDSYCDGLGACLPACPVGAIKIIERTAIPFDEVAVRARQSAAENLKNDGGVSVTLPHAGATPGTGSCLANWPVQIKLVPVNAPYLRDAALLIAADCTAFAYPDIHRRFMANKVTLIGCPKLDGANYAEKLAAILQANVIRSLTVLRMEVPCCAGLANAAKQALLASGKSIPWHVVTLATDGAILDEQTS